MLALNFLAYRLLRGAVNLAKELIEERKKRLAETPEERAASEAFLRRYAERQAAGLLRGQKRKAP